MFLEHLRFRVAPEHTDDFAAHNRRWREALAQQEGYIEQVILHHADEPDIWLVIVRWRDRAVMEGFPDALQEELDAVGNRISTLVQADHFEEAGA